MIIWLHGVLLTCVAVIAYTSQFCLYQVLCFTSVVILLMGRRACPEKAEFWRQKSVLCYRLRLVASNQSRSCWMGSQALNLVGGIPTHGRGSGTRWNLRSLLTQTIVILCDSEHSCEIEKLERRRLISRIHLCVRAHDSRDQPRQTLALKRNLRCLGSFSVKPRVVGFTLS